jgi:uncharacterized protein (DUF4415 family)
MKENVMKKITKIQQSEIDQLNLLSEDNIDTSDIQEIKDWSNSEVGKFFRPKKQQVTLRLDADMLDWFRHQGNKYQTRMNQILRHYMDEHQKT